MMSTLRRFGTLDGRSLGPHEEPAIMCNTPEEKENVHSPPLSKSNATALASERNQGKPDAPVASESMDSINGLKAVQKFQSQKLKKVTNPTSNEMVSGREDEKEAEKETKKKIEEEELVRGAGLAPKEDLRQEKEAAELKEQLRLEQIAKAKEAEEQNRIKAAKAEIRAQKESELREKHGAKKERKERKAAVAVTDTETVGEADVPAPMPSMCLENVQEQPEKASVPSEKPSRSSTAMKQYNKIKPFPLPLRNRGKRKMQAWNWMLLTALIVPALFVAGNLLYQ